MVDSLVAAEVAAEAAAGRIWYNIKDMDFLLELFSGRLFLAAVKGEKL